MTFYDIRIEPKKEMNFERIKEIIENAFKEHGGLTVEGVEYLNHD